MPRMPSEHIRNPQTEALLEMLQLPYNLDHSQQADIRAGAPGAGPSPSSSEADRQQRLLSGRGGARPQQQPQALPPPPARTVTEAQVAAALANPEEIDLDGDEDDGGKMCDEDGMRELEDHEQAKEGRAEAAAEHLDDDPMFQPL